LAQQDRPVVTALVRHARTYYEQLADRPLKRVVEFGCAGGWFLRKFLDAGVVAYGYEGSSAGIRACSGIGVPHGHATQVDLRMPMLMALPCDMAICTEVAEHIEPPLAGILVWNLIQHADLIWWSSASPGITPHLHHPNEQPLAYWIALFEFFGYGCYMLPDSVMQETNGRGRCIFYDKKKEWRL